MFAIKTLIELFDSCQIKNVIAGLRFAPEKIVFIGFKDTMTSAQKNALERFFKMRKLDTVLEYEIVGRYNYEAIVEKLNSIVEKNDDCCFDLTGGKELVLTAMGEVSAKKAVPMFQFNVRTSELIRVKNCEKIFDRPKPHMSIIENVTLNGGSIVQNSDIDYQWSFADDLKSDVENMWHICRQNCGIWNRQCNAFGGFEFNGRVDGLRVCVDLKKIKDNRFEVFIDKGIIDNLVENNLISDYSLENNFLTYKYKNKQVRKCLTKAGNVLELYTYIITKEIALDEPGFYDDIDIGVVVDWDGIINNGTREEYDTRNEVDIILMRDLVPIFISCKNGEVNKEALYELFTVAERFGGQYVKKILLTSYLSTNDEKRKYILQRARDMGIDIIENVDKMSREEFKDMLKRRAK